MITICFREPECFRLRMPEVSVNDYSHFSLLKCKIRALAEPRASLPSRDFVAPHQSSKEHFCRIVAATEDSRHRTALVVPGHPATQPATVDGSAAQRKNKGARTVVKRNSVSRVRLAPFNRTLPLSLFMCELVVDINEKCDRPRGRGSTNPARLSACSDRSTLRTHRYGCLGEGDEIERRGTRVIVVCRNGGAPVLPPYSATDAIGIGRHVLPVRVKEPTTLDEIAGYHKLEDYHYRGKVLHGRRVPLIVQSSDPLVPGVLGYIELSTSFMMNRPRAELFNAAFSCCTRFDGNLGTSRQSGGTQTWSSELLAVSCRLNSGASRWHSCLSGTPHDSQEIIGTSGA